MKTLLAVLGAALFLTACAANPLLQYADAGSCEDIQAAMEETAERIQKVGNLKGGKSVAMGAATVGGGLVGGLPGALAGAAVSLMSGLSIDLSDDEERLRHLAMVRENRGCK